MPNASHPTLALSNCVPVPVLGLGTWKMSDAEAEASVRTALDLGYRHIDTASLYANEPGVGRALRASELPRDAYFVTTKCWNDAHRAGPAAVKAAFADSLRRLGLDYVDLYLLHWPCKGAYVDAWSAMEEIYESGKAKAVGVSNFLLPHLEQLLDQCDLAPHNNQIELHPRLLQPDLLAFCKRMDISVTAWSPLMKGKVDAIPEITRIAATHGKTPAQIALRWNVQHGLITIPKSTRRERLIENAAIFDFTLTATEMATLDALDRHERTGPDPDNFNF